eukprot:TRINITY_DN13364_c0_g1_i1.p1 TRINITY_DN13364_c0_g1~~TRINITY_DN13364_c0_g1_i1.p1  ORF type:complete len:162 (+),score=21.14 TRINITY_DN13364_c0_g1_i1:54-488(+)
MGFTAVFLDDDSKDVLRQWAKENIGNPIGRIHAEHMTINGNVGKNARESLPVGKIVALRVIGYAKDKVCQAVVVSCPAQPSVNSVPHITISTNGVQPSYSNQLLERHYKPVEDGPWLFGGVEDHNPKVTPAVRETAIAEATQRQ